MEQQSGDWPETKKVLTEAGEVNLAIKPKLTRALLLDFINSPSENRPRELTAMTRQQESDLKSYTLALKYREQEIRLRKMGEDGQVNIETFKDFLGVSQTSAPPEPNPGFRKEGESEAAK